MQKYSTKQPICIASRPNLVNHCHYFTLKNQFINTRQCKTAFKGHVTTCLVLGKYDDYDYALEGYNNSTASYNWNLTELNYLCCHEIDSV